MEAHQQRLPGSSELAPEQFASVLEYMPEIQNEKLAAVYFSPDLLRSRYAQDYWMLPDLHGLVELPTKPTRFLGRQVAQKQQGDPDRLLRFAFVIVQRYLRADSTRRRSWYIDLGFAAIQQQTIRLRTQDASIPAYSVTHIYFYVQMVHVALSQLLSSGGTPEDIERMSYPAFRELFGITPTVWTQYYSQAKWYSLECRVNFLSPDLQPSLPTRIDIITTSNFTVPANDPYYHDGLLPEIPSTEILNFHLAILLEDAKSLPAAAAIPASSVTTHAALLKYIHNNLIRPPPAANATAPAKLTHHLSSLLKSSSPNNNKNNKKYNNPRHLTFWITTCLLAARSTAFPVETIPWRRIALARRSLQPSSSQNHTSPSTSPATTPQNNQNHNHRTHNCPCHPLLPLTPKIGSPDPVLYPSQYPYNHPPQQNHACDCHKDEPLSDEAATEFARRCAEDFERNAIWEKQRGGIIARPVSLVPFSSREGEGNGDDGDGGDRDDESHWENFMRFNSALAWEGLFYGSCCDHWGGDGDGDGDGEEKGEKKGNVEGEGESSRRGGDKNEEERIANTMQLEGWDAAIWGVVDSGYQERENGMDVAGSAGEDGRILDIVKEGDEENKILDTEEEEEDNDNDEGFEKVENNLGGGIVANGGKDENTQSEGGIMEKRKEGQNSTGTGLDKNSTASEKREHGVRKDQKMQRSVGGGKQDESDEGDIADQVLKLRIEREREEAEEEEWEVVG